MNLKTLLLASLLMLTGSYTALADTLLFSKDYTLRANTPYETGFFIVFDAPVQTDSIYITQSGSSDCNIQVADVEYVATARSAAKIATPVGTNAVYEIPDGVVYAINIKFAQRGWDRVVCTIKAYDGSGNGGGGGTTNDVLLGALRYSGGFDNSLSLAVSPLQPIKSIRLAVPTFCGAIDVLSAGTVVSGVFYAGRQLRDGRFSIQPGFGTGASSLQFALNGPIGAQCDIPVYVEYEAE